MVVREEKFYLEGGPTEPDEGWWAAVLADEPKFSDPPHTRGVKENGHKNYREKDSLQSSVNWARVEILYQQDDIVSLKVVGFNRGGILVADDDIHGFVPTSHLIDIPSNIMAEDREYYLTSYLDRQIALKVIECEPEKERVVFSERAALAKEGQRNHLLHHLNPGDVVHGVVTNLTSFGAFVDLGGLEGLIHVSELSWGRVHHPSDIVKLNDEVRTKVLQISEDQGRIALSLKQLQENPWESLAKDISAGDVIDAEISSIVKYGAFAKLNEGIEGLIHISSMNFPEGCSRIEDFLYEGQVVRVCVLNFDAVKRRLGLKLESC